MAGHPCAVGCGRVYTLVQKENLEMRIMGFKAPHCGTVGNSLEGGQDCREGRKRRQFKTLRLPRKYCGLVEEAQKSHSGPGDRRAQTRDSRPGPGPGDPWAGAELRHQHTTGFPSHGSDRGTL